jgi:glycerol-3-phosphate acyltransferase PlsY
MVGAVMGINPPVVLLCFAVWMIMFVMFHYVSLASMVAGCCYPFFVTIFMIMSDRPDKAFSSVPFIVFAWLAGVMLVWTHRKNIGRLRDGTESQIYLWGGPNDDTKPNINK